MSRDYSVIRDRIAQDFYRAAGVREKAIAPTLGWEQIAELNRYADSLPFFSTDRKEFREATRLAGENLCRTETQEAARKEAAPVRGHDLSVRGIEQSHPDASTTKSERSDRDSFRGR